MERKYFNGEKLKAARKLRGYTITELSNRTGISKQSISLYESNQNTPEFERCNRLAQELDVPTSFFMTAEGCKTTTPATYFRSLASATKTQRVSQSLKLEYVAKIYDALSTYIDFPSVNLPHVEYIGGYSIYDDNDCDKMCKELEGIAITVREHWGLGNGPIGDLQYALESNGIVVTGFNTDGNSIDAFSQRTLFEDGYGLCFIAVDQGSKPEGRIRFDMSHELAHLLIHPWTESIDEISKEEFKAREYEANVFASAFLLPRETFGRDVSAYPTDLRYYAKLKTKWKSSVQSMVYRAYQLKIITISQFQYMMRQISKKGWRLQEPGDEPYYLNENIFQGAIDLLKSERILSSSGLLSLFADYGVCLYPSEIENLLHLKSGTLNEETPGRIVQLKLIKNDNTDKE